MRSVALKITDKTEILQAIITNLRKAAKLKLPKQPPIEDMLAEAYNKWFSAEVEPHLNSHFLNLLPLEEIDQQYDIKHKTSLKINIKSFPNVNISYEKSRNSYSKIGNTKFKLQNKLASIQSDFTPNNALINKQALRGTAHRFSPFDTSKNEYVAKKNWGNATTTINSAYLEDKYFDESVKKDIEEYNHLLTESLTTLIGQIEQITLAINKITTTKKFREKFPQLVNLLPADILEKEREKPVARKPKPKEPEEDEAPDINLNQIAKDIAYAKIME